MKRAWIRWRHGEWCAFDHPLAENGDGWRLIAVGTGVDSWPSLLRRLQELGYCAVNGDQMPRYAAMVSA